MRGQEAIETPTRVLSGDDKPGRAREIARDIALVGGLIRGLIRFVKGVVKSGML